MKKVFTSLLAAIASLGVALADTEVTFNFSDPASLGLEEKVGYLTNPQSFTSGDVTLTFSGTNACRILNPSSGFQLTLYKSATASKVGTLEVKAAAGNIKKVEMSGLSFINGSFTYDCGISYETGELNGANPTQAIWAGDDSLVVFKSTLGNANIHTIKVTLGEKSAIRYPKVTPNAGTLYAGINNVVQVSAEEGATVTYRTGEAEFAPVPAEGLTVAESGTYQFKAEKEGKSSAVVSADYTVITPAKVLKASDLKTLTNGAAVQVAADWTVVAIDTYNKYYFVGDNAAKEVMALKTPTGATLKAGDVIKSGWVAKYANPSNLTYQALLTLDYGTLTAETSTEVKPLEVSVKSANEDTLFEYTRVLVKGVKVEKVKTYFYTLTDKEGNVLNSYEQWNSYPALEEGKLYDVDGILYTDDNVRYLYPETVSVSTDTVATQPNPDDTPEGLTFDFTKPADYGFVAPELNQVTKLENGATLISNDIVITNVQNGKLESLFSTIYYDTQFANTAEQGIELQIRNKSIVTFTAPAGKVIKKMVFHGSALNNAKTFNCGSYTLTAEGEAEWNGADAQITLTNAGDFFLKGLTVTVGDAPKVAYPIFSSVDDVLYEGITAPKTITLTCDTEGATFKYRMSAEGEWMDYTDGIIISQTCTVWAKAVKGEDESVVVSASYTVNPVAKFASFVEFQSLEDASMAATSAPLSVIYHWKTAYYSVVLASDGVNVLYLNDTKCKLSSQLQPGQILSANILGKVHKVGYMNMKPDFQMDVNTVNIAEGQDTIVPTDITLTELNATPNPNKYLVLKGVEIAIFQNNGKPVANNYVISDKTESTMRLYNRFSLDMTSLEDAAYDVAGVMIDNGTMLQFYPVSIQKSASTAIREMEENAAIDGKFLIGNQLVIRRGNLLFNAAGQLITPTR